MSSQAAIEFVLTYIIFLILAFVVALSIEIAVLCCHAGRKYPNGHILLGIFTICFAYMIAVVCASTVV